jgi:DUF1680 family protein
MYIAGSATISIAGNDVEITQQTNYPWEENIKITVNPQEENTFELALRIPGWLAGSPMNSPLYFYDSKAEIGNAVIKVNGQKIDKPVIRQGYAKINRTWSKGDVIELHLPMPAQRVYAHPAVKDCRGRMALMRGPVVYCLEAVDNGSNVLYITIPKETQLSAQFGTELLGGVVVLKGHGMLNDKEIEVTAVPYYAWDNREKGEMTIWIPEVMSDETLAQNAGIRAYGEKNNNTDG